MILALIDDRHKENKNIAEKSLGDHLETEV